MVNGRPRERPRGARYSPGPGSASLIPIAASPNSGAVTTSATPAHTTSNRRFTIMQGSTNGHEDFGGVQALLVAPGARAVSQRVERAGMWIGAQLAGIAGHRGELDIERRGDIHPRVRGEGARKRPLGAAGGVESGAGPTPARRGPRRDQRRLKQKVMVAVDVAAVLAIHDLRLHLLDDLIERGDEIRERHRIEPLIREAERPHVAYAQR